MLSDDVSKGDKKGRRPNDRPFRCTVGQINKKYRLKYWATRSSVRSFARTAHFAHSLARGKVNYQMAILSVFFSIFDHRQSVDKTVFVYIAVA